MPDADAPTTPTEPEDYGFGTFMCEDCPPEANIHPRKSNRGVAPKRCDACKATKHSADTRDGLNKLRADFGRDPLPSKEEQVQQKLDEQAAAAAAEIEEAEAEAAAENEAAVEETATQLRERTWLDDDEAQELLKRKREAEVALGVAYNPEAHGTVEEFLADADGLAAVFSDTDAGEDELMGDEPQPAAYGSVEPPEVASAVLDDHDRKTGIEAKLADNACVLCGVPDPPHVGLFCAAHWQQVGLEDRGVLLGCAVDSEPFAQTVRRALSKLRS